MMLLNGNNNVPVIQLFNDIRSAIAIRVRNALRLPTMFKGGGGSVGFTLSASETESSMLLLWCQLANMEETRGVTFSGRPTAK